MIITCEGHCFTKSKVDESQLPESCTELNQIILNSSGEGLRGKDLTINRNFQVRQHVHIIYN